MLISLTAHINSHTTNGQLWPDDATHAVVFRKRVWPYLGEIEYGPKFFTNSAELAKWEESYRKYPRIEEHYGTEYSVYEWDLGPQYLRSEKI